MEECVFFSLVGSNPYAVANSLTWFLQMKPEYSVRDLIFICSREDSQRAIQGTATHVPGIKKLIQENCLHLNLTAVNTINFSDDILTIPEANLPEAAQLISKAVLEQPSKTTILDITAGRKLMSSASVIAGVFLDKFQERRILFYYYWLFKYTQDKLARKAYQLGFDAAETVIFEVKDILLSLSQLGGK